jgi:hypothetical protein
MVKLVIGLISSGSLFKTPFSVRLMGMRAAWILYLQATKASVFVANHDTVYRNFGRLMWFQSSYKWLSTHQTKIKIIRIFPSNPLLRIEHLCWFCLLQNALHVKPRFGLQHGTTVTVLSSIRFIPYAHAVHSWESTFHKCWYSRPTNDSLFNSHRIKGWNILFIENFKHSESFLCTLIVLYLPASLITNLLTQ